MPKVSPFHSVREPGKAPGHRVYHIYNNCPAAERIRRKEPGKDNFRLCDDCKEKTQK
jgi:hypothetical protein